MLSLLNMNFGMFLRKLRKFLHLDEPRPKISILIPFGGHEKYRKRVLRWVIRYWSCQLPNAEIVIGYSRRKPFCKTEAFNNAARKAKGEIFVLLDADAYMPGHIIDEVSDVILEELELDNHLWYVPYRHLYRLTPKITNRILRSDPCNDPFPMFDPPPDDWVDSRDKSGYGRRYGAMIMVFPRQAYELLGGFDERFRGWGGEDVALLRALDTLWGKHKSTNNSIFHLWHPQIGNSYKDKKWRGQKKNMPNGNLALRYHRASGKPTKMKELIEEGHAATKDNLLDKIGDTLIPNSEVVKEGKSGGKPS